MTTKSCPHCHTPIPANAPGGFCPACLLRDAGDLPLSAGSTPSLEVIAVAFPQLEILSLIGRGGMGCVYQVRQPGLDRVVALKILSPGLHHDPSFAERFAREARVLGKLNHPNIVTVFEHGESGGHFYLLMEFVDGVNLRQAMAAGRFTPEQALAIVPGICDALQAAHAQGIWHRDIKPENILLDATGRVKIADFGIARIVGDPHRDFTLTRTGGALGSAVYMAPEQHEKPHDVDHRADIYSLGVVIYEMLTGELPLGRFPLPSRRAAVDERIDEIILRTLEKERELRHQSAGEVKTDVQRAAGEKTSVSAGELPKTEAGGLAKLAFGLLLMGLLGPPILVAIFPRHDGHVVIFCGASLLLSLALGAMSWRNRLGKFACLASCVVLAVATFLAIGNFAVFRSLQREGLAKAQLIELEFDDRMGAAKAIPALPAPEYDFSTTRDAVESLAKAARKKDAEAFKRGISQALLDMTSKEDPTLAEPMRDWERMSYRGQISQQGDRAEVGLKNGRTNAELRMHLVREAGDWKLANPGGSGTKSQDSPPPEAADAREPAEWRLKCPKEVLDKSSWDMTLLLRKLGWSDHPNSWPGGVRPKVTVWAHDYSNFDKDDTKDWVFHVGSNDAVGRKVSGTLIYDRTEHGWSCVAMLPGTFPVGWSGHAFEGREGIFTREPVEGEPGAERVRYFRWNGEAYIEDHQEIERGG